MEDEWYIESQLLLAVLEAKEGDEVIYDRFRCILRTDEVKSCKRKHKLKYLPTVRRKEHEPATRSGNSFLRARQSSVNQSSSSGVITLMVV